MTRQRIPNRKQGRPGRQSFAMSLGARDPRWGRGQETYGEDPFLTAMLGRAFVRGLQGNDPRYLKAAACAKHYAVHSGPAIGRFEVSQPRNRKVCPCGF